MTTPANHSLQRTRPSRYGCNRSVSWARSLSLVVRRHVPLNHMKSFSLSFLAVGWMMCCSSALAEHATHLRGIINLPELRMALVEVKHSLRSGSNTPPHIISTTRLVKVGESFEDQTIKGAHVQMEILEIDSRNETVKLREDGKDVVCRFAGSDETPTNMLSNKFGCHFQEVRFEDVLDLYSGFRDRTVLIHPKIIWSPVSLRAEAQTKADIAGILEKAFLERGITTVSDGDKFVLLVPTSLKGRITVRSKDLDATSPQYGTIYMDAPITMVMEQYGRILGRTRIGGERIPEGRIYLRTKMLTKAEVLYAFDTVLAWNGFQIVSGDDNTFIVTHLPKVSDH
jgi:hypothetical protein